LLIAAAIGCASGTAGASGRTVSTAPVQTPTGGLCPDGFPYRALAAPRRVYSPYYPGPTPRRGLTRC